VIPVDRARGTAPEWLVGTNGTPSAEARGLRDLRAVLAARKLESKDFDEGIYKHADIRDALWAMQHHKCCYCENKYERSYSDVEHFRPKAAAVRGTEPGDPADPGYWWLAYRFENLYFACAICNRSHKRAYFPLEAGSSALAAEDAPPGLEKPLLLDPAAPDLADHLKFVQNLGGAWRIAPRNRSPRGKTTIKVCGLGRPDLDTLRAEYVRDTLQPLVSRFETARTLDDGPAKYACRTEALALCGADRRFSLLARAVFEHAQLWGDGIGPP
jgi:uncharacterized protein (TIGR02646 family)